MSQATAQGLIEKFGPVEGLLIWAAIFTAIYIINNWLQRRDMKTKAVSPIQELQEEIRSLRVARGSILDMLNKNMLDQQREIARIELAVEKRVPFDWAEKLLIPKIDTLAGDVSKLTVNVENQIKMTESQIAVGKELAVSINALTSTIRDHDARIRLLEKST